LHLEQGEFAVRYDWATLAESRSVRVGGALGTRVRIGGFPIYLGGFKSVPKDELREVGAGELVLTNRRLLFLAGTHTLVIPLDRLLMCEQSNAGLVVSESRSKHPHTFAVKNEGLWCFLVDWIAKNRFAEPKLPDTMHISVTGQTPHLQVRIDDQSN
jgi:hypothetical protein